MTFAIVVAISSISCSSNASNSSSSDSASVNDEDVFNSEPTGDPKEDAEALFKAIEQSEEIKLESMEAYAQMLEYYAEKGDYEAFQTFVDEYEKLETNINLKHLKEEQELEKRLSKARAKLSGNNPENIEETPDSTAAEIDAPTEITPDVKTEVEPEVATPIEQPEEKEP